MKLSEVNARLPQVIIKPHRKMNIHAPYCYLQLIQLAQSSSKVKLVSVFSCMAMLHQ